MSQGFEISTAFHFFSDAFMQKDKSGRFEWTARVLNINKTFNLPLQNKCKPLYAYIQFTSRINENKKKGMTIEKAVEAAIIAVKEFNATPEVAAQKMDAPLELVLEGLKKKEHS